MSGENEAVRRIMPAVFDAIAKLQDGDETCTAELLAKLDAKAVAGVDAHDERLLFALDHALRKQAKRHGWLFDDSVNCQGDSGLPLAQGLPYNLGFTVRRLPITKIEYEEGGFFSSRSKFILDVKGYSFVCGKAEDPFTATLVWEPRWRVPKEDISRFASLVGECHFLSWEDVYKEPEVCDGTQWEMRIKSGRHVLRKIYGSNLWPAEWDAVVRLLEFCHCTIDFGDVDEEYDDGDV